MKKLTIVDKTRFCENLLFPVISLSVTAILWFGLLNEYNRQLSISSVLKVLWPY